ncbi:hypothetical protein PRK78_002206 [Emydomyces testavorans]|uniref:Protein kinase domain-containing protein n=1 Tax=Emydomyces testavorans TaxID=2070801 RepID=A0AAF0IG88_9EURO|nr:hypothetical protein PRK78_002206 [Emydomyces testavorans]
MAGPPPASWEKYWDLNKFCAKSGKIPRIDPEDFWAKQRDLRRQRKRGPTGQEADQLYDLLRSMLKTDPHDRPRIGVLLNHPWFGSRASAANNSGDSQRN